MLKIEKKTVLAPIKVFLEAFTVSLSSQASSFSVSRSVCFRPCFALQMAETAKRAITCLVPRHASD